MKILKQNNRYKLYQMNALALLPLLICILGSNFAMGGGASRNRVEPLGRLVTLAEEGNFDGVEKLVKGGANVNQRDSSGRTALLEASASGFLRIVDFLLLQGANANR